MYSKNKLPPVTACKACGKDRYRLPNGRPRCVECDSKRARNYHANNGEKHKARVKSYYYENKEKFKDYYEENKEAIRAYKQEYSKTYNSKYRAEVQHPDYQVWCGMKSRCNNINHQDYSYYGGRGIKIYEPWNNSFKEFITDVGPRPEPKHLYSIERKDVNGNYEPGNVVWATRKEQANNTRRNRSYRSSIPDDSPIYYPFGVLTTLKEFAEKIGLPLIVAKYRYATLADADYILQPTVGSYVYQYQGHMYNMTELSLLSGITHATVFSRIRKQRWSVQKAVEIPFR